MRFQVPQFIEVEDRIFGPLTVAQFIYLAGGGGFLLALWLTVPTWLALILGVPVAGLGAGLAFLKIHERPLIVVLEHAVTYYVKDKLYIWNKREKQSAELAHEAAARTEDPAQFVANATSNKIKDLAWSLDIRESVYSDQSQK